MTTATLKKRSHHKKPDTEKAARFTGGEVPTEKKELFGKKEVHAPATQEGIAGGTLKKTPPLEVCEAAESYLDRKTRLATAKDEAGRAAENLLGILHRHKLDRVTVSDATGKNHTLTVQRGEEKIKVESADARMEITE